MKWEHAICEHEGCTYTVTRHMAGADPKVDHNSRWARHHFVSSLNHVESGMSQHTPGPWTETLAPTGE